MQTLASLGISLGVMLVAAGLGRRLQMIGLKGSTWSSHNEETGSGSSPVERIVVDTSLGLGLVSAAVFVLAAAQLLRPIPGVICTALLVIIAIPGVPGIWFDVRRTLEKALRPDGICAVLSTELLLVIAAAAIIPALAPPAMTDWDSLAYHLAVPKLFIEQGGFHYIHFATHSNFPFLVEMLYIPGLAFEDPVAAKLMHYWFGVLLVAAVIVLARRHVTPKAAPAAAIAVAGMPIVLWESTTAYVDLATALYTVLAVHLLLNYLDGPRKVRSLIACACATGFAASTKMTGLALIPMLAIWLATADTRRWRHAILLAGLALAVCWPWYFKSFIYTGNPVYPFFYCLFGGRDWSQALADNYTTLQKQFGLGHGLGALLLSAYNITFHSEAFYDRPGLFVGPLMLIALPVVAFARYRSTKLVGMLAFAAAQLVFWFCLTQQSRYLIPTLAVIAVVASGLAFTDDRLRWTKGVLAAVFVVTALFGVVMMLWPGIRQTSRVVFGAESRKAYLLRHLDIYPACNYVNTHLPKGVRVALFGDTRGFYLERPYAWADAGHNLMFSRAFGSVDELSGYLRQHGFTHALVNFGIAFPQRDKALGTSELVYEAVESGRWRKVFPTGMYGSVAVYKVI